MRIMILLVFFFNGLELLGCTCANYNKKQLLKHAEFAVVAEVIEPFHREGYSTKYKFDVKVKIIKSIKGGLRKGEILVVVSSVSGSCAEDFIVGKTYFVTGGYRLSDYWTPEPAEAEDEVDDEPELDESELPPRESYEKYLNRITNEGKAVFTSMCQVLNR